MLHEFSVPQAPSANGFETPAVAVPVSGDTVLGTVGCRGCSSRAIIEVENTDGADAFDSCIIEAQAFPEGAWFTYLSSAQLNTGTAIPGKLISVTTNPTTLAAGAKAIIIIDTTAIYAFRVAVSANGSPSAGRIRGMVVFN